jgi:hypothetical protein
MQKSNLNGALLQIVTNSTAQSKSFKLVKTIDAKETANGKRLIEQKIKDFAVTQDLCKALLQDETRLNECIEAVTNKAKDLSLPKPKKSDIIEANYNHQKNWYYQRIQLAKSPSNLLIKYLDKCTSDLESGLSPSVSVESANLWISKFDSHKGEGETDNEGLKDLINADKKESEKIEIARFKQGKNYIKFFTYQGSESINAESNLTHEEVKKMWANFDICVKSTFYTSPTKADTKKLTEIMQKKVQPKAQPKAQTKATA